MTKLFKCALASVMLFSACARVILPDPKVPHQLAEETVIKAWCRAPDGKMVKCKVRVQEGWWFASPQLVE